MQPFSRRRCGGKVYFAGRVMHAMSRVSSGWSECKQWQAAARVLRRRPQDHILRFECRGIDRHSIRAGESDFGRDIGIEQYPHRRGFRMATPLRFIGSNSSNRSRRTIVWASASARVRTSLNRLFASDKFQFIYGLSWWQQIVDDLGEARVVVRKVIPPLEETVMKWIKPAVMSTLALVLKVIDAGGHDGEGVIIDMLRQAKRKIGNKRQGARDLGLDVGRILGISAVASP